MALHLVRGDEQPFSIFSTTSEDHIALHSDLCRVTVGHVAAGFGRLIWHVPRRIELLVQWKISDRMTAMFLRFRRNCQCDQNHEDNTVVHTDPSVEGTSAPHCTAKNNKKLRDAEQRGAQSRYRVEALEVGTDAS
jgi:hypothetical protein